MAHRFASKRGRLVAALCGLTLATCIAADATHGACLTLASRDGGLLASVAVDDRDPAFAVTYMHSVTRTPVDEIYRVEGPRIVETEIRFVEHGPGLPTTADDGGTFEQRNGQFVVRGHRGFDTIVMRIHADQHPALITSAESIDLARWGNRALAVTARSGACPVP